MEQLLEKIDRLKAEYEAMQPISAENHKKLDKKIRLEFNFNSNHIEGNTLTYGETELLLYFEKTQRAHDVREIDEMKAHDVAFQLIQQWAKDTRPIAEADIKNLNKVLLVRPYWKEAITPDGEPARREILVGEYKQYPDSVQLANGEIFEYASPIDTPVLMGGLVAWYNAQTDKNDAHPLLLAAMMHYRFVRIHPFDDGNGRVSRLLMNYVLLRYGFPPVIIKSADKTNYLRALNQADTGNIEAFARYAGEQLIWSLELCIKAAKGETLEEADDLDKELAVLQKELSGRRTLKIKASPEIIKETVLNSLVPLLQIIEDKLQILLPSFCEAERQIMLKKKGDVGISQIGDDKGSLNEIFRKWFLQNYIMQTNSLNSISYHYHLKGFKGSTTGQNFSADLEINMGDYAYTILNTHYPYGQLLSFEQIQEIIEPIIRNIIEQIKMASANSLIQN